MAFRFVFLAFLVSASFALGCKPAAATVDSTTAETFEESIEEMRKGLDVAKRKDFDAALSTIMLTYMHNYEQASITDENHPAEKDLQRELNGKTVNEILVMANKMRLETE